MISFRYHIVTIVAVFLALAVGVALGGGPLSDLGRSSDEANSRVTAENERLSAELDQAQQVAAFQDAFGSATVPADLDAVLADTPVAILTMPGASQATVEGLTEQIERAEGTVAGTYAVQQPLLDADNKPLVDTLGAQLLETVSGSGIAEGATTYVRMGGLLSRAVSAAAGDDAQVDEDAQGIRSSLSGAEMLSVTSGGEQRASVILVVLGTEPPSADGSDKLLSALFAGLTTHADAVVVAGSTETSEKGILNVLREAPEFTDAVSSVDSAQTRTGQIAVVYALGRLTGGATGQFGANGTDGPFPRG